MATQSLPETPEKGITITHDQFAQIKEAAGFFDVLAWRLEKESDMCDAGILMKPVSTRFWDLCEGIRDQIEKQAAEQEGGAS